MPRAHALVQWILILQVSGFAMALCEGRLAAMLDEGLQRALLVYEARLLSNDFPNVGRYVSPSGGSSSEGRTSSVRDDEVVVIPGETGPFVDPDDPYEIPTKAEILSPEGRANSYDCDHTLERLALRYPTYPPPSVAPPELERELNAVHTRGYLVSLSTTPFSLSDPLGANDSPDPVLYWDSTLGLALVRVETMLEFRNLVSGPLEGAITHVLENYPLMPAINESLQAIDLVRTRDEDTGAWTSHPPFDTADGSGYSIAIVDTGVRAGPFPGRIILEACFSTHGYPLTKRDATSAVCPPTSSVFDAYSSRSRDEFEFRDAPRNQQYSSGFQDDRPTMSQEHDASKPVSVSSYGPGTGAKCNAVNDCQHGTKVAYIAAGAGMRTTAPGVAPNVRIIAIQVASQAPGPYCTSAPERLRSCAVIFPLDVIRALAFLKGVATDDTDPAIQAHPLVAINLSLYVSRLCDSSLTSSNESCESDRVPEYWETASYDRPCENTISTLISELRNLDVRPVWTVVAAGNRSSSEPLGGVSLPACAFDAVTVGSTDVALHLSESSMHSHFVDLTAPGENVVTHTGAPRSSGTSFAAPQVTGALALLSEVLTECSNPKLDPLEWLEEGRVDIHIEGPHGNPWIGIKRLGLRLTTNATGCRPTFSRKP